MDSENDNEQHKLVDNKYMFDFEQVNWSNVKINHSNIMTRNASKQIEKERENIEKDLKLLQAIEKEKSRLENLMVSFIQLKHELEEKLKKSSSH